MTYSCSRLLRSRLARFENEHHRPPQLVGHTGHGVQHLPRRLRLHQRLQREATRQKRLLHIARNGAVVFAHMLA